MRSSSSTATNTFMKLTCDFNICVTYISPGTAASTSCREYKLTIRDSDAHKPGHPTRSAEPSGNHIVVTFRHQSSCLSSNHHHCTTRTLAAQPQSMLSSSNIRTTTIASNRSFSGPPKSFKKQLLSYAFNNPKTRIITPPHTKQFGPKQTNKKPK